MLAYEHADFLRQAIEGVLLQKTEFAFELIIAEDCSSDDTRAIALEYQRLYPGVIRVLYSAVNIGASANSYRALRHCRGEYVAYCEGDDFWHSPDKLQRQVEILDAHPKVGLVFSGGRLAEGNSVRIVKGWGRASALLKEGVIQAGQVRLALLRREWHPLTCSCMARRQSLDSGYRQNPLFMVKLALGDTLTWLEILREKDAYYIDEDWVTQVVHAGSATDGIGREYVTRDGCMILCYFAALTQDAALALENRAGVLKARLALASASRSWVELGRVIVYCWRKHVFPGWQLLTYMGLASVGLVAWGQRLRRAQRQRT